MTGQIALSGEGTIPQCFIQTDKHWKARDIAALNVQKRLYQKMYMEYWNKNDRLTGTGRPVDAIICPVAPHAAVIPRRYRHVGYTSFVNVLDYTSAVIPVTNAGKAMCRIDTHMNYLSETHEQVQSECKFTC